MSREDTSRGISSGVGGGCLMKMEKSGKTSGTALIPCNCTWTMISDGSIRRPSGDPTVRYSVRLRPEAMMVLQHEAFLSDAIEGPFPSPAGRQGAHVVRPGAFAMGQEATITGRPTVNMTKIVVNARSADLCCRLPTGTI